MPVSLVAAAVLLTLFVPGYLFQAGVAERTNILKAERDVYAIAQAVAISAGILLAVFAVLMLLSLDGVKDDLLHDPATSGAAGLTSAQLIALVALLVLSNPAGKAFGWLLAGGRGASGKPTGIARLAHGLSWLLLWPLRLVLGLFFPKSPLDREFDALIAAVRSAEGAPFYVRVVRQGEEDVIGVVDGDAATVSDSPRGSGLALTRRWLLDPEQGWRMAGGAHVAQPGVIEVLWWGPSQGTPAPAWLEGVPGLEDSAPEAVQT